MRMTIQGRSVSARMLAVALLAAAATACSDGQPVAPSALLSAPVPRGLQAFNCTATTGVNATVSCALVAPNTGGALATIFGSTYVKLTSSNVSYDSVTWLFQFDVTVTNLMNEAIGTPDGTTQDPQGIQVFFDPAPYVSSGTGTVELINADGVGTFTASNQFYFEYDEILTKNQVSAPHTWQLEITPTVSTFSFAVYVETDAQYLLVINEVMVNPGGSITDANGEWVEVYNAGTRSVQMQGLLIADSSASGRRPYHAIGSYLVIPSGGYVTLGSSADSALAGGVQHNYVYGSALTLANSADAVKLAVRYGVDTVTIDRTQYSSAAISAQNGISRELKNPSLDNSNMDGSNWADALSTAVYGTGGRGTPKAQNSTYTP